jgi:hypothetical protein
MQYRDPQLERDINLALGGTTTAATFVRGPNYELILSHGSRRRVIMAERPFNQGHIPEIVELASSSNSYGGCATSTTPKKPTKCRCDLNADRSGLPLPDRHARQLVDQ